ncbi:MAG TPA: LytTR family DNA-binding domain-containing protein, partial [Stellaceae bacterium]|nr:LytTR family DNA-binding domain-containing protein [Stellaceae bacterium]
IVALAAFVVCGLFLLAALPLDRRERVAAPAVPLPPPEPATADTSRPEPPAARLRLPYEHNGTTFFIDAERVHAIKAEGHYTKLYDGKDVYFCPWSISRLETHLAGRSFLRTHRSFLVNIEHAGAFQRRKDKAFLIVPALAETMVPVSRFHVADVRRALGL